VLGWHDADAAGIAGVVLTIGMAVDANVLIYERLREELAKGKSLRGAIAAGYAARSARFLILTSRRLFRLSF